MDVRRFPPPMWDFHTLTYRGQQRRLRRVAETALASYGLAGAPLRLVKYEDNAVYRVTGPGTEQFALRVSLAPDSGPAELVSELRWVLALRRDTSLLVPEPVPMLDGQLVHTDSTGCAAEARCSLFRWVPGREVIHDPTPTALALAGEATAGLHQHARRWRPPSAFVRPRWDLDRVFGPASVLARPRHVVVLDDRAQAIIAAAIERVRHAVAALGTDAETFGLLHADLNLANFVRQAARLGIIDFDDCGWGYYLYDLATTLCSLRRRVPDPPRYARLSDAYVAGYTRMQALPTHAERLLATFMAFREMVIVTFILESANLNVLRWGMDRIAEAVDRLEAYLNERPPTAYERRRVRRPPWRPTTVPAFTSADTLAAGRSPRVAQSGQASQDPRQCWESSRASTSSSSS